MAENHIEHVLRAWCCLFLVISFGSLFLLMMMVSIVPQHRHRETMTEHQLVLWRAQAWIVCALAALIILSVASMPITLVVGIVKLGKVI